MEIKSLLQKVFRDVLRPTPRFHAGDAVQTRGRDTLMYVTTVSHHRRKVIYLRRWYDHSCKASRTGAFQEDELDDFDWYRPEGLAERTTVTK